MSEELSPSLPEVQPNGLVHEIPFKDYLRQELQQNGQSLIRSVIPSEFSVGSEDALGDVRYRFCSLPDDDEILQARLEEIREKGTDRTDPNITSRYDSLYRRAAEKAQTDPMNIMDTMGAIDFFRRVSEGLEASPDHYGGANGVLVYDAKTDRGIKYVEGPEYTFKDLNRRNEALLAIIRLK